VQLGGNRRAFEFMLSQPDFKPTTPIREKYNTRAAALYREKVRARQEGDMSTSRSSYQRCRRLRRSDRVRERAAGGHVRGPHVDARADHHEQQQQQQGKRKLLTKQTLHQLDAYGEQACCRCVVAVPHWVRLLDITPNAAVHEHLKT